MLLDKEITEYSSHDGLLYINMNPHVDVHLRYYPWKEGLIIERRNGSQWTREDDDPQISLITTVHQNSDLPVNQYIKNIPPQIQQAVEKIQYLQTSMLQLASRSGKALEILYDAPLLLWMIAEHLKDKVWSINEIDELLGKKRSNILSEIVGVGSQIGVKFIKKIQLLNGDGTELKLIKEFVADEQIIYALRNLKQIPIHILYVVKRYPEIADSNILKLLINNITRREENSINQESASSKKADFSPCKYIRLRYWGKGGVPSVLNYLEDIGDSHEVLDALNCASRIMGVWYDAIRLGQRLNINRNHTLNLLNRCKTEEDIQQLHDQWIYRTNKMSVCIEKGKNIFSSPPIPGNKYIIPILTEEDLIAEGKVMRHCIGSYADEVRNGKSYIYRVLSPERATLEIRCDTLKKGQFKLAGNQNPSSHSLATVNRWLTEYKTSSRSGLEKLQRS